MEPWQRDAMELLTYAIEGKYDFYLMTALSEVEKKSGYNCTVGMYTNSWHATAEEAIQDMAQRLRELGELCQTH